MKIAYWILSIAFILLLIVAGVGFLHIVQQTPAAQSTATQTQNNPVGSYTAPSTPSNAQEPPAQPTSTPTAVITTYAGAPLTVDDFLHNPTTAPDVVNPGVYYLAGAAGYCTLKGYCPSGATSTDFTITYDQRGSFFNIVLEREPLGNSRLEAEAFLAQELGVPSQELCSLNYSVGVTAYVNPVYSGQNLGFSFCPTATPLP